MSDRNDHSERSDRLRALLRRGDPAGGELSAELSAEEVRTMRRTVLNAVPEPRRRAWLVPVLATAASLTLAVALSLSLWPHSSAPIEAERGGRRPLPRTAAGTVGEGSPRSAGEGATAHSTEEGEGTMIVARNEPSPTVSKRRSPPSPPNPPILPPIPEEPRQIQFSTPGGTRVIWMLNPATE